MEAAFLQRVQEAVAANLSDARFGVEALAEEIGMSPRPLQRKLKALLGERPKALIRRLRLERAAQMLKQEAASVKEVAYAVGFQTPRYFRQAFREAYGVAPLCIR